MAQKFLIVKDKFVFSHSVQYHRELMPDNATREDVDGGGWFYLDRANKKMYLFSKSEEFGIAHKGDIINALKRTLFMPYMDGVKFYISYHDDLKEAMKQEREDWIYDDSSELIVDDKPKVTESGNIYDIKSQDDPATFKIRQYQKLQNKVVQTPIRNENKVSRNEICPCGSGKKYKRCCITK
jgi:hypothetical protein